MLGLLQFINQRHGKVSERCQAMTLGVDDCICQADLRKLSTLLRSPQMVLMVRGSMQGFATTGT